MFHVTNGDSAAGSLRQSELGGDVLAWRDVLHDGPVPAGEDAAALRATRARFIADAGWAAYDAVLADFAARDAALERRLATGASGEEIVLWFEHDLYDQLQLIQVLDRLSSEPEAAARTALIRIGEHPDVVPFYGLGQLRPDQLVALYPARQPVSAAQLALAHRAWDAFRAPDPTAIERVLAGETDALPFLRGALERWLEEFPSVEDGLSRTEHDALALLAAGAETPVALFAAHQQREQHPFLGDTTFFSRLGGLASVAHPALAREDGQPFVASAQREAGQDFRGQRLVLTDLGRALLAGSAGWVALNGIERWLGGVHLSGSSAAWRWSRATRRLVPAG